MSSVHGQHQVGGLGLGGQTRGGAAALNVQQDQGYLQGDGQPEGLRLEGHAGSAGRGNPQSTAVGGTKGGTDRRDFVFGLEGDNPEPLVAG